MDTQKDIERVAIRWNPRIRDVDKDAISIRFGFPRLNTLNGISPGCYKPEDKAFFFETAKRGFFSVLPQKWCKNGAHFIFIS